VGLYSTTKEATEIPVSFDPCGSLFVVFRPDAGMQPTERMAGITRNGQSFFPGGTNRLPAPKITVERAVYGVPGDATNRRDVTALVRQFVAHGIQGFWVEYAMPGTVGPGPMKTLWVDYTIDGRRRTASGTDREFMLLAGEAAPATSAAPDAGDLPSPIEVGGPWELRFPKGSGAPETISLDRLISWSQHADPGVKYFSGTATYRATVDVPGKWVARTLPLVVEAKAAPLPLPHVFLDLGRVEVIARVRFNGHDQGVLWKPPFRVDVTDVLHAGKNSLEIEVVNLWPNRLIGDDRLPADCKWQPNGNIAEWPKWMLAGRPSPSGRHTFVACRLWTKDSPPLDSGLLGPVRLEPARLVPGFLPIDY
jgi:hypothetical protein